MIKIDRSIVSRPAILDKKNKDGKTETERAKEYYTPYDSTKDPFKFKIYAHTDVKDALIKLFKNKCAYCESTFLHVYSGDVEHFRPKGEIEEATPSKKPGYYWLAADWDNLLLSCRNCNQKLKHIVHGAHSKKTMGKMNQFPLSNSVRHARDHNDSNGMKMDEESRLLLNPCIDNPEDHLEYGKEGVIRAKKDENNTLSAQGEKSIEVYVLQRVPLVQAREKTLIEIEAQIQRVKEATQNFNHFFDNSDTALKFYFEKILKRELARLKRFLDPEEQYVGMARQKIGEFLNENFNISLSD